jgi:phage gpG-like protein
VPSRITWQFYGDAQVDRTLERIELAAADASPAFELIAEDFLLAEREQFASEGAAASGGWPALSEGYAAWKAAHFPGQTILRRTDELYRSLTEGPEIRVIEPHLMILGSAVPYGRFHQEGTDRMPQRRPVELTELRRRQWVKMLQRWIITGGLRGYEIA